MSKNSWWRWLGKTVFPEIVKGGMSLFINDLRTKHQQGLVNDDYLAEIEFVLEDALKTLRQMRGATGDRFMDEVRRKAKTEIREMDEK